MTKIKDISSALELFEKAAVQHAEATEQGDYKTANKNYSQIIKSISYLKERNSLDKLLNFLPHSSVGVRMWAATYLLPIHETKAIKSLETIMNSSGIHSLTAETTVNEWRKGNLKF